MNSSYIGQAIIYEDGDGVTITIPSVNIEDVAKAFMVFWLFFWCLFGIIALGLMLTNNQIGKAFALFPVWAGVAAFIFRLLYWDIAGMEIIVFEKEKGKLTLARKADLFYITKEFDLSQVRYFRARSPERLGYTYYPTRPKNLPIPARQGAILFSYSSKTVAFGMNIDKDEGEMLLKKLRDTNMLTDENF